MLRHQAIEIIRKAITKDGILQEFLFRIQK